jgi:Domain of unknown function (DUF1992)
MPGRVPAVALTGPRAGGDNSGGMTERKPPGVSWESWFEEQIRRAREDGAFDNLEGAGKPLADLEGGHDPDWWVKKLVQREKVSVLPAPLQLLRKVEAEVTKVWALRSETDVRARALALNAEIARTNARAAEGPPTRLGLLDVDVIVGEWRARSAHS